MTASFGLAYLTKTALRREATFSSEIVTEIVAGDLFRVESYQKGWWEISHAYYPYRGWMNASFEELTAGQFLTLTKAPRFIAGEGRVKIRRQGKELTILQGCDLPNYDPVTQTFGSDSERILYPGRAISWQSPLSLPEILDIALTTVGNPYVWGGTTLDEPDCSGFVLRLAMLLGIQLHRNTSQQVIQCTDIAERECRPGDLVFFKWEDAESVTHVALVQDRSLSDLSLIHAVDGEVRNEALNTFLHRRQVIREHNSAYLIHSFKRLPARS